MLRRYSRALVRPLFKNYYDAEGRQIKNLADPVADQDAATGGWVSRLIGSILETGQGPVNNAANVLYVFPDGVTRAVQRLAGHDGIYGIGLGEGSLGDVFEDGESSGTSLLPYMTRDVRSRLRDRINLLDYIPRSEHAAILAGTSTTDCAEWFNAALASLRPGGSLYLPDGIVTVASSINIGTFGINIIGQNAGHQTYTSVIKCTTPNTVIIRSTAAQVSMQGVGLWGPGSANDGGVGNTVTALDASAPSIGNNLDMTFEKCFFAFVGEGVVLHGRNAKFIACLFSTCRVGVRFADDGFSDMRGLTLVAPRFHSVGATGTDITNACIVIPSSAGFAELIATGIHADDCAHLFYGFASNSGIEGVHIKARGTGVYLDSTGATAVTLARKGFVCDLLYQQDNPTAMEANAVVSIGTHGLDCRLMSSASGGSAIVNNTAGATFRGVVRNAGQIATGTRPSVQVTATTDVSGLCIQQDVGGAVANKPSYALSSTVAVNLEGLTVIGTSYALGLIDAPHVYGKQPAQAPAHESAGAAAPTTGTWFRGDRIHNSQPSPGGVLGWICTQSGTPGVWRSFGSISAS